MLVDLNLLLSEEEYEPRVGTQYEVAPGKIGTMKHPTIELQDSIFKMLQDESVNDFSIMQQVLGGISNVTERECVPLVPSKAGEDFFSLLRKINERLRVISEGLKERQQEGQDSSPGPSNG